MADDDIERMGFNLLGVEVLGGIQRLPNDRLRSADPSMLHAASTELLVNHGWYVYLKAYGEPDSSFAVIAIHARPSDARLTAAVYNNASRGGQRLWTARVRRAERNPLRRARLRVVKPI